MAALVAARGLRALAGWGAAPPALLRPAALSAALGICPAPAPAPAPASWAAAAAQPSGMPGRTFASKTLDPVKTKDIRDIAIIAHVDHGKTTLMDRLLAACNASGGNATGERVMDSINIEKERGITISAKYTSFQWNGCTINAVDTPGHADFGGEVERALDMVDGCVLLVDATEGPLAQTKFVLAKALAKGLQPLVVMNKIDRESATRERCELVESDIFDLFANLGATEEQLDFRTLYASARDGWATEEYPDSTNHEGRTMKPLLDAICESVPCPKGDSEKPFAMLVSMIDRDTFLGRVVTGRVAEGTVRVGDKISTLREGGSVEEGRVTKLIKRVGMDRMEIEEATAGDVITLAGLESASVTDTVGGVGRQDLLPSTPIDPPTIAMKFSVNNSALGGREGTQLTGSKIGEYLKADADTNVSLRVHHIGAGFELSVSPPEVVIKLGPKGEKLEPVEEIVLELDEQYTGAVIERLTLRKGELLEMVPSDTAAGRMKMVFTAPSRGLIGFQGMYNTLTSGSGLIHRSFHAYEPYKGRLDRVRKGVLVSMADGKTTAHALNLIEPRGVLFVTEGIQVYSGMIVGEHTQEKDLEINPVREKKLSNMRSSGNDENIKLRPPRQISLEYAIGYVNGDELIEVTPSHVRLRKRELDSNARERNARNKLKEAA